VVPDVTCVEEWAAISFVLHRESAVFQADTLGRMSAFFFAIRLQGCYQAACGTASGLSPKL
jgi:hypothetical protein